ncbi:hypothetical protein [Primorskyibacter sp. S187A]|uniref:hypothetical protein n=1 Tax=Primorskyibacter sp. S187A TaxID=3415130 RepID=UPI003C7A163F
MLELLGTIGGNVLSLPGILGLAVGMMTRNIVLAAILGGVVGLGEAFLFGDLAAMELGVSVLVGVIAASLGSLIRRKGATV